MPGKPSSYQNQDLRCCFTCKEFTLYSNVYDEPATCCNRHSYWEDSDVLPTGICAYYNPLPFNPERSLTKPWSEL